MIKIQNSNCWITNGPMTPKAAALLLLMFASTCLAQSPDCNGDGIPEICDGVPRESFALDLRDSHNAGAEVSTPIEFATSDYAIEFRMMVTELGTIQGPFAFSGVGSKLPRVQVIVQADGQLRFLHRTLPAGSGGTSVYSNDRIPLNQWVRVVAMRRGVELLLYLDGVLQGRELDPTVFTVPLQLTLGRRPDIDTGKLRGYLDNFRVWNRSLSSDEIESTENELLCGDELGLVACWRFDEGAGKIATDLVNGLQATLVNNATWHKLPHEVSADCDANDQSDFCEITLGTSSDCNGNFIPDSCDLNSQPNSDCDTNGVLDACESENFVLNMRGVHSGAIVTKPLDFARSDYTIEVQIFVDAFDKTQSPFMFFGVGGTRPGVQLYVQRGGQLRYLDRSNVGSRGGSDIISSQIIPRSKWIHVATVKQGTELLLYLDGALLGKVPDHTRFTRPLELSIGRRVDTSLGSMSGCIDELRVWTKARTRDEILATKDNALCGNESGLHAYWSFNEGQGRKAFDLVNHLPAILVDGATWISKNKVQPSEGTRYRDMSPKKVKRRTSFDSY